jgi:outer membrane protein assembly factor BamA
MKTLVPRFSLLLFSLLCVNALAPRQTWGAGQATPPTTYKLISVTVKGSRRFTQQDIVTASGLPVGTVARQEDFQKAARQLGESGAFGNIDFTYSYSGDGTKLEFKVTDADKFVPAHFTDFVWFSDKELLQKLHSRIPLFDGELPASGSLAAQVSDVLQALLVENAAPGQVEYTRTEDKSGKLQSIDYNVVGVSIRIHHAEFPGASPVDLPLLQTAAEKLYGREYSRAYMGNFVEHSLLPIYRERGYLKVACSGAEPKVVKPAAPAQDANGLPPTYVDVTFPVSPGIQYKLSGWEWSGNKTISTEELQPFIHAKAGQIANTVRLEEDLQAVQQLYGSRGYILASVKVGPQFNDPDATVNYLLDVDEGSLFHMGDLEFRGLDNNLTARLRDAWKLRPGDIYDATYLEQYLPLARKLLPPSLDWEVSSHVTPMTAGKTVDVDLQYTAKAPR